MKRRKFLGLVAGAAAMTACSGFKENSQVGAHDSPPVSGPLEKVHLAGIPKGAPDRDLVRAVKAAALSATDFSWLSKGDTVFIKPAHNSGLPYPSTTHPLALSAMIELLKEKGAGRVLVGDMAGIQHLKLTREKLKGSTRRLMEKSGVAPAVEKAGGELYFWEEAGWDAFFEERPESGSHWKSSLMMPKILNEVDHIVLMPRCGRHALTGSTLGMKCAVGYWRTDTRLEYHRDASSLQEKTAEANTVPTLINKQRLTVSAADKVLACFGPDKGFVAMPDTGLIMASTSVVAHDMVSLAWQLEMHRMAPEGEKYIFSDPYTSQIVVNLANRWVVGLLDGWGAVLDSEKLVRNDLGSIWDDRVLAHAFKLGGGAPGIQLVQANAAVSEPIIGMLTQNTRLPDNRA